MPCAGQIFQALESRYLTTRWQDSEAKLTDKDKIALLNKLPEEDTLEFMDHMVGDLYPLDTAGLHYIDLDQDGDLDLVYASYSGTMGAGSAKVYLQEKDRFNFVGIAKGWIRHIEISPQLKIYTFEHPCCDSYTNSIKSYALDDELNCAENIVYISVAYDLARLPDLDKTDRGTTKYSELFISPKDLRGTGYFRDRTKEIHDQFRAGNPVMCGKIPNGTEVGILDSAAINDQDWYLVITDPITKPENSLFEDWQTRVIEKSRYLGWVRKETILPAD